MIPASLTLPNVIGCPRVGRILRVERGTSRGEFLGAP